MIAIVGAVCAASAVASGLAALRRPSNVARVLARLAPRRERAVATRSLVDPKALAHSGVAWTGSHLVAMKAISATLCAGLAIALALVVPIGPVIVAGAAYAGFVAPTLYVERLARCRRERADRAMVTLVEWIEALVASGRPAETAIVAIAERGVNVPLIDDALRDAARAYALGAPLFAALARAADAAGVGALGRFARELERTRDLGRGVLTIVRDERDRLRSAERARSLDVAGRVEGRLMLVLVLCYLPALMLLVVIPLFLGLLDGLFAGGA